MSPSSTRLSYKSRVNYYKQRLRVLVLLAVIFVVYLLFTNFWLSTWRIESESMKPGIGPGTHLLVSTYLLRDGDGHLKSPLRRGDIVFLKPSYGSNNPWYMNIVKPVIRFFSAQTLSLPVKSKQSGQNHFKRIIGIPGDSVKMINSIAYVKKAGDAFFFNEWQQSSLDYEVLPQKLPDNWSADMPFSPSSGVLLLGDHEYFILGDNREFTNDSRYQAALNDKDIRGRALLMYWPVKKFGKLR